VVHFSGRSVEFRDIPAEAGMQTLGIDLKTDLLMLRSQRLMIELDAFFVPEAQQTLAGGGAIAEPPET
jgi:hypothetical protein